MKKQSFFVLTALAVLGLMLTACGAAPTSANTVGAKVDASPIEFTGIVEAIEGNEVTIDGQVVVVSPEMLAFGNFAIGDTVEVEATTDENDALVAESIELHNDDMDDDADDDSDDDVDNDSDDDMDNDSDDDVDNDSDDDMDDDSDDDVDNDSDDDMDNDSDDDNDDNDDDDNDDDDNDDDDNDNNDNDDD